MVEGVEYLLSGDSNPERVELAPAEEGSLHDLVHFQPPVGPIE